VRVPSGGILCGFPSGRISSWIVRAGSLSRFRSRCVVGNIPPGRGSLFASAGLWERWRNPKAEVVQIFTILAILTTTPNELCGPIHDRMPVDPGARGMADLAWRGRGDHRSVARHPATASDQEDTLTRLTGGSGMSATMTPRCSTGSPSRPDRWSRQASRAVSHENSNRDSFRDGHPDREMGRPSMTGRRSAASSLPEAHLALRGNPTLRCLIGRCRRRTRLIRCPAERGRGRMELGLTINTANSGV
jgi:SOS response associated peptidase (SRAP)